MAPGSVQLVGLKGDPDSGTGGHTELASTGIETVGFASAARSGL